MSEGSMSLLPSPLLWQGLQLPLKCGQRSWSSQTLCITLLLSLSLVRSHQSTACHKCLQEWDNLYNEKAETLQYTLTRQSWGLGWWNHYPTCSTELLQKIVPVFLEVELQYYLVNPYEDAMSMLSSGHSHLGTKAVFVRLSTFEPHLLASSFLTKCRSPKVMGCKPLVDWLMDSIVYDNAAYVLGVNPDTMPLAVESPPMEHWMILHKSDLPGCWAPPPSTQAIDTRN